MGKDAIVMLHKNIWCEHKNCPWHLLVAGAKHFHFSINNFYYVGAVMGSVTEMANYLRVIPVLPNCDISNAMHACLLSVPLTAYNLTKVIKKNRKDLLAMHQPKQQVVHAA